MADAVSTATAAALYCLRCCGFQISVPSCQVRSGQVQSLTSVVSDPDAYFTLGAGACGIKIASQMARSNATRNITLLVAVHTRPLTVRRGASSSWTLNSRARRTCSGAFAIASTSLPTVVCIKPGAVDVDHRSRGTKTRGQTQIR